MNVINHPQLIFPPSRRGGRSRSGQGCCRPPRGRAPHQHDVSCSYAAAQARPPAPYWARFIDICGKQRRTSSAAVGKAALGSGGLRAVSATAAPGSGPGMRLGP